MKYSMFYIYGATIHWKVEIIITIIGLLTGREWIHLTVLPINNGKKNVASNKLN